VFSPTTFLASQNTIKGISNLPYNDLKTQSHLDSTHKNDTMNTNNLVGVGLSSISLVTDCYECMSVFAQLFFGRINQH
jgi:hypothetical protein